MMAFFLVGLSSSNESLVAVDLPVGVEVEDSGIGQRISGTQEWWDCQSPSPDRHCQNC